jgi:hypothetical protein
MSLREQPNFTIGQRTDYIEGGRRKSGCDSSKLLRAAPKFVYNKA